MTSNYQEQQVDRGGGAIRRILGGESLSSERLRAEPWISFMIGGQDGGFGGHRTGGRVGASVSEATNDLQHF